MKPKVDSLERLMKLINPRKTDQKRLKKLEHQGRTHKFRVKEEVSYKSYSYF